MIDTQPYKVTKYTREIMNEIENDGGMNAPLTPFMQTPLSTAPSSPGACSPKIVGCILKLRMPSKN